VVQVRTSSATASSAIVGNGLGAFMKSLVVVHGITLGGHRTSVSLEEPFWIAIEEIAKLKSTTVVKLVEQIDSDRDHVNLSSAIRLFVLDHFTSHVRAKAVVAAKKAFLKIAGDEAWHVA
jgi:predicted DNA-binding ribbon-helix-helix protein